MREYLDRFRRKYGTSIVEERGINLTRLGGISYRSRRCIYLQVKGKLFTLGMRIGHRYLTWDSHTKTIKPLRSILDKFNISYKYKEDLTCVIPTFKHTLEFYLYDKHPDFHELKKQIDKYDVKPQIGTYYEKSDMDKAEWFIISTGEYQYPQPENDFGYLEATFNLDNYCRLCGIGKVQNAPFRLKAEPKQYNNQFWGLHWEFEPVFVRQETKIILEKEQMKGIRFSQPVLHKKNAAIDSFYQLHIDTILKEGFDNYNTKTITCKINNEEGGNIDIDGECCGRIKFHHPMVGGYLFNSEVFDTDLILLIALNTLEVAEVPTDFKLSQSGLNR